MLHDLCVTLFLINFGCVKEQELIFNIVLQLESKRGKTIFDIEA